MHFLASLYLYRVSCLCIFPNSLISLIRGSHKVPCTCDTTHLPPPICRRSWWVLTPHLWIDVVRTSHPIWLPAYLCQHCYLETNETMLDSHTLLMETGWHKQSTMLSESTESTLFDYKTIMLLSVSTLSRSIEGVLLPKGIAFYICLVLFLEERKFPGRDFKAKCQGTYRWYSLLSCCSNML